MVRPIPTVAFPVVTAAVFKLLLFVLKLGNLTLIDNDLSLQLIMYNKLRKLERA